MRIARRLKPGYDVAVPPWKESIFPALPIRNIGAASPPARKRFRIATYNIGFASGPTQSTLNDKHPRATYEANLSSIIDWARVRELDMLLLQEVDLFSERSHYVDQLAVLQRELGWGFSSYMKDWDCWVPFMGIGRIRQCACVISRNPIEHASGLLFKFDPQLTPRLKNLLYKRFVWWSPIMHTRVQVGDSALDVFNVHLDVFQRAHRKYQIAKLCEEIEKLGTGSNVIVAGDFNFHARLRTYSSVQVEDEPLAPSFDALWDLDLEMSEAFVTRNSSSAEIHSRATLPEFATRADFLFYSKGMVLSAASVESDIASSDHLPLVVELSLA